MSTANLPWTRYTNWLSSRFATTLPRSNRIILLRHLSSSSSSPPQIPLPQWRRATDNKHSLWQTHVPKPWLRPPNPDSGAMLLRADGIVPSALLEEARLLVEKLKFDRDEDSVDGAPTFELQWINEGRFTHAALAALFRGFVEEELVPLLRRSALGSNVESGDGELVLCEALVRMYDERRVHPAHYDGDALVRVAASACCAPGHARLPLASLALLHRSFFF